MWYLRFALLAVGLVLFCLPEALAQIPENETVNLGADSLAADTLSVDSSLTIKIKPNTKIIPLQPLLMGVERLDSINTAFEEVHYWDEIDTIGGFVQELGQIGKPYRQYRFGLPAEALMSTYWVNPINNRPDVYMYNPETQLHPYDTRTPFVDAEYKQNANFFQLFKGTISQNIRPWWNLTVLIRRRRADGLREDFLTRHWNVAATNYFRSINRRYMGFVTLGFSKLNDQIHGGVIEDSNSSELSRFAGVTANLEFGGSPAVFYRSRRFAYTAHTFHIVNDSVFKIGPTGSFSYESYLQTYTHPGIRAVGEIDRSSFPYAQIVPLDTTACVFCNDIYELNRVRQWESRAGAVATLKLWGAQWHNRFLFNVNQQQISGRSMTVNTQNRTYVSASSKIRIPIRQFELKAHADFESGSSNLFGAFVSLRTGAQLDFFRRDFKLIDSTYIDTLTRVKRLMAWRPFVYEDSYVPFKINFALETHEQNPSLMDTYWEGATFAGNPNLGNQSVFLARTSATYTGSPGINRGLRFLQDQYSLGFGVGRLGRPWYYTEDFTVAQSDGGVVYTNLTGRFRQRFWRFYLQNETSFLLQSTTGGGPEELVGHLPRLYGRARLSYRERLFRKAADVSIGIEAHYRSSYDGYRFAPATQAFFPQSGFTMANYVRLDAFLSARIDKAMLFFRLVHLNEGIGSAGYWTAPFYPMLGRSFSFGVRWRIYD